MIALVIQNLVSVVSLQFSLYLSLCQAAIFYKWTSCIYLLIIKSVIPSVSGPDMSLNISLVDFGKFFMKPSRFWRTLMKPSIKSRVDSRKPYQKLSGFSQTSYQKSSGFSQTLSKAEWILANLIKSRVDSRKPYQKSSGFSQTSYQKPSGFSQTLSKAEWIIANINKSRVDSRKPYQKPSGFSQTLY